MDFTDFSLIYPDERTKKAHERGTSMPDIDMFTLQELFLSVRRGRSD